MNEKKPIEYLTRELRRERVDRYELERSLHGINSMHDDLSVRGHNLSQDGFPLLLSLIQTIQDDIYRLTGYTWRFAYLKNKRNKDFADKSKLYKELEKVDKEIENLVLHFDEAERILKEKSIKPKPRLQKVEATLLVLFAVGSLMYSTYKIDSEFTGFATLNPVGFPVYFVLASLLVLSMLFIIFKIGRH